jgi:hypothetical protein
MADLLYYVVLVNGNKPVPVAIDPGTKQHTSLIKQILAASITREMADLVYPQCTRGVMV